MSPAERLAGLAPWWVVAYVAAWPWPGAAEILLSLGALIGLFVLLWTRFRGGMAVLSHEAWALTSLLFLAYWLPEAISALDAGNGGHSAIEAAKDLRYLPFLWLVGMAVAAARGRRIVAVGIGAMVALWTSDALLQAATGFSLGGASDPERLSGIFGADNLKLGIVLASMLALVLVPLAQRKRLLAFGAVALAVSVVVLMAGARAAWLSVALAVALSAIAGWGWRRALPSFAVGAGIAAALAYAAFGQELTHRIERTMAVLSVDRAGLDHALSGRVTIWSQAAAMAAAHPINGVGVDNFQTVYQQMAPAAEPVFDFGQSGAYHAHQIVLEVLSETGLIGLMLWLSGVIMALRAWRFADADARDRARPSALALLVTVFPFNTHLAFYSTFWGGVTLLLAALFAGSLLARDRQ